MISKELLSEVLGYKCNPQFTKVALARGELAYYANSDNTMTKANFINIYELAHKCKEWALIKHGFTITSFIFRIDAYPSGEYDGAAVIFFPDNETPSIRFDEATISEAIFKACQWILDNKETK